MSEPAPRKVRSVFVSDLHLGYKGADIAALNGFLRAHDFERLYLVGDILDGWKLEKRWYWNRDYSEFLDSLLALRRRSRITLITGNHDERLRDMLAILFRPVLLRKYGIRVEERIVHRARDGRQFLVMHGDQFDGALTRGSSKLADRAWSFLVERALVRPRPSEPPTGPQDGRRWSLGKEIAKNALNLANRFHQRALRRVAEDGLDGIVCGHSHLPVLREQRGLLLANCGSWTGAKAPGEMHTALVETLEGQLEMIEWPAARPVPGHPRLRSLPPRQPGTRHPDAARLVRMIHALWSSPHVAEPAAGTPALTAPDPAPVTGDRVLRQTTA
ncbi:UDP-2,3-diacylglucosamine diphosphatase [Rhodovulum adriaticum]|uniref:UDP-2,3-diacylglucosamine pyrophosphatase LpxH n=1 Tax=Rhodovulum adriaticum TaxID=35804 RepID=A0A4R2NJQ7_RHOAD|nr:UDP-2,3-diacylglucosamine diphosphatase [Rhodovulum adriaticum]MBK1636780.1 hypothetical protein [Rhodovulum adriaticum]TCP21763.1 UDP-2,3-diacylglucosamine pyrophosphatase LpxH [Rhodovulum adriaticum]